MTLIAVSLWVTVNAPPPAVEIAAKSPSVVVSDSSNENVHVFAASPVPVLTI
jgi:hypothetical protein